MSEKVPLFDEQNDPTGQLVERDALYSDGSYHHRTAHSMLYLPIEREAMDPDQVWVQQRSSESNYLPNAFSSTAGGHLGLNTDGSVETYEEAIRREQQEELFAQGAVPNIPLQAVGQPVQFKPAYPGYCGGMKFVQTFVGEYGGPFNPSAREVKGMIPMAMGDLKEMARREDSWLHPEVQRILNEQVRIGIVGTYSVGKTTLTRALGKRLSATPIEENVRVFVRDHFGKNGIQELTPDEFIELEHLLYEEQVRATRTASLAVVDSTPIGCPIYLENYGLLAENGHKFEPQEIERWKKRVQGVLDEYDMIVYLPPEIPFEDDGFRTKPVFRQPIDDGFREAIKEHPRAVEIRGFFENDVEAGVNQRVETVIAEAQKLGLNLE